jgi:hypothetical protein
MDTFVRLTKSPIVSIAKIRGRVRGVGSEFVLACDMRFASPENTFLAQVEVGAGVHPGGGGAERFPYKLTRREWISEGDVSKDVPLAQESVSCLVVSGVRRALLSSQRRLRFEVAVNDVPFNGVTRLDNVTLVSRRQMRTHFAHQSLNLAKLEASVIGNREMNCAQNPFRFPVSNRVFVNTQAGGRFPDIYERRRHGG